METIVAHESNLVRKWMDFALRKAQKSNAATDSPLKIPI